MTANAMIKSALAQFEQTLCDYHEGKVSAEARDFARERMHKRIDRLCAKEKKLDQLLDAYMHACGRGDVDGRDRVRLALADMAADAGRYLCLLKYATFDAGDAFFWNCCRDKARVDERIDSHRRLKKR